MARNVPKGILHTAILIALLSGLGRASHGDIIAEFDYFASSGLTYVQPFYLNYEVMQTFTPIVAGSVTSVDVTVHRVNATAGAPLTVRIFEVTLVPPNGLQPTGSPLSTGSLASDDPQFDTIFITWKNISMSPVTLNAGQTYGLVLDAGLTTDQEYDWYSKEDGATDLYTGGNLAINNTGGTYAQQNDDVPFRIHAAAIPEPSSIVMLVMGVGLLMTLARHRNSPAVSEK